MMRLLTIFLIAGLLKTDAYAAVSDTISLNGIWKFKTDLYKNGEQQKWYDPNYSKDNWTGMEVPGNWDLKNEFSDYTGDAWYSFTFKANNSWNNKHIRLVFESVYNDAEVWLNGNKIGENHLGFLQFYFDISKQFINGEKNEIVVKVNNVFKRGAIWNWGGIRRPVWLEITEPQRINRIAITTNPDLIKQIATVNVKAAIANYSIKQSEISYSLEILYQNKSIYNSGIPKPIALNGGDSIILSKDVNLTKTNTHLWHFDHPELYTAKVAIYEGKQLLHVYKDRFGIRKIEVDGLKLRLNGEEIRPVGFNLVPEDRITGNTLPFDRIKKMVDMMKEAGANMARLSHMSLPKEFLDYLDEKGIMIFEEVFLWGKDAMVDPSHPLPKLWLERLIRQEYNHPSIIGWSVGNEIGSLDKNPLANEYIKVAIENAKKLDPHRLAVYVSNSVSVQANDASQYSDLIMLNSYSNWVKAAEKAHEYFPDKPIFFSEFGENLTTEDPNESIIDFNKMLKGIKGKDYIIGASLWTLNDYRSSYWSPRKTWETLPSQNRTWGVVNTFLQKKKSYAAIQKAYLPFSLVNLTYSVINNKASGKITLKVNEKLDFPAYQLKGYQILVKALTSNRVTQNAVIKLPLLSPGDANKTFNYQINLSEESTAVKISLSDPQNYSRFDTTIYIKEPLDVIMKSVHTSADAARIVFEPNPSATHYTLKYGIDNLEKESLATINNFVQINNLKSKSNYQFQILAHNNKGIKATEINEFSLDEDELPPIIWAVEPVKNGFFVSFSGNSQDYRYEIKFGEEAGNYTKHLTFNNYGVIQIPDLDSSKTYFFKLRRIVQWGFASEWTNEVRVKPL
ncbi:glycoside hydrolase family 2 protein [Pedobacter glucosidilyticus]|uniref:glycoside hydrolase family 2 protein n=1 Tax=Pedobacter glucosidilyticus TaxID=1122941 RepID=UPI00138AD1A6|nr:glycoside hydrolase family 2 TIM barrel-domain containing protein [Pedobacter glucosidilyticus]